MVIGQVEWALSKNHIWLHFSNLIKLFSHYKLNASAMANNKKLLWRSQRASDLKSSLDVKYFILIWEKWAPTGKSLHRVALDHLQFLIIFYFLVGGKKGEIKLCMILIQFYHPPLISIEKLFIRTDLSLSKVYHYEIRNEMFYVNGSIYIKIISFRELLNWVKWEFNFGQFTKKSFYESNSPSFKCFLYNWVADTDFISKFPYILLTVSPTTPFDMNHIYRGH